MVVHYYLHVIRNIIEVFLCRQRVVSIPEVGDGHPIGNVAECHVLVPYHGHGLRFTRCGKHIFGRNLVDTDAVVNPTAVVAELTIVVEGCRACVWVELENGLVLCAERYRVSRELKVIVTFVEVHEVDVIVPLIFPYEVDDRRTAA